MVILTFCSKHTEPNYQTRLNSVSESIIQNEYGYILNSDELKNYASSSIPQLFSLSKTKGATKEIESITPFIQTEWMSDSAITNDFARELINSIYIVNYKGNAGFALLSADNRIEQLLAYSDNGSISPEIPETKTGVYDNTGEYTIYDILDLLPYYVNQLSSYIIPYPEVSAPDSLDANGYYFCAPRVYYSPLQTIEENYAFTGKNWSQGWPYNNACYIGRQENENEPLVYDYCPVGCVALALGQIMAYHNYPTSLSFIYSSGSNTTLNWSVFPSFFTSLTEEARSLAELLRQIGEAIHTTYNVTYSEATADYIQTGLTSFGYTSGYPENYTYDKIKACINNYGPVLTFGVRADGLGHAWVIEGYKTNRQLRLCEWSVYDPYGNYAGKWSSILPEGIVDYNYVYCNWGCGGTNNGLYSSGLFNFYLGNYSYNNLIVSGIHPL